MVNSTPPPTFTAPTVAGVVAQNGPATPPQALTDTEARLVSKLRALLVAGRGSLMVTVAPGSVQFWRVLPDGRSELG